MGTFHIQTIVLTLNTFIYFLFVQGPPGLPGLKGDPGSKGEKVRVKKKKVSLGFYNSNNRCDNILKGT